MNKIAFSFLLLLLVFCVADAKTSYCDEPNIDDVVTPFEKAAYEGDAKAQWLLGFLYREGKGVRQDYTKAREWFEKAAAQGDAEAQCGLGFLYYEGKGVIQDYTKAREWFEKAAAQGDATAQLSLGVLYYEGKGVRQNSIMAKEWFGKACDGGLQVGCDNYKKLNLQSR